MNSFTIDFAKIFSYIFYTFIVNGYLIRNISTSIKGMLVLCEYIL